MFDLIDSLIATITVVLILSLIVQSISQIVKQLFNMKSKFMERELFAMFAHVRYKRSIVPVKFQYDKLTARYPEVKDFVAKISGHMSSIGYDDLSTIESLKKDEFLRLVGDLVDTAELESTDTKSLAPDEKSRIDEKMDFLQRARSDIEKWYDTTMRAFQNHYERRMKMWAFGMSALVVIWLNANIFDIYGEFSRDKILRAAMIKMGEKLVEARTDTVRIPDTSGVQSKLITTRTPPLDTIRTELTKIGTLVSNSSFKLMRWERVTLPQNATCWCEYAAWLWSVVLHNFFGWVGMTLLVGLGAPFWYDLLKTLVGVKDKLRGETPGGGPSSARTTVVQSPKSDPATSEPPAFG